MIEYPNFSIEVTYDKYHFTFTSDPLRKMSHVLMTEGSTIWMDKMLERNGAVAGVDFHLSGIEVFTLQAIKEILQDRGVKADD